MTKLHQSKLHIDVMIGNNSANLTVERERESLRVFKPSEADSARVMGSLDEEQRLSDAVMLCEESSAGLTAALDSVVRLKPDTETSADPVQEVIHCSTYVSSVIPAHGGISLNSEEPFCRICHEGSSAGDLLSPCECAGSLAMVHRVCLEHWLTASGTSHCELCHFQFALERLPKPLTEWFTTPSMQHQRRTLCGDVICFLFITPLASLSGWLCVQGAMDLYYSNSMEAIGLIVLTLTLFTIYLFWSAGNTINSKTNLQLSGGTSRSSPKILSLQVVITSYAFYTSESQHGVVSLRYHIHLFRTWNSTNPSVRLQIPRPVKTHKTPKHLTLHFLCKYNNKETMV
ncbi:E3 ubiquitin-protein ligase MARCH3 [Anabarilius grahami]|uniref:E3 ubiquitin-protein ligase MARCH3 n=1 Tax=Anabarilius grahami TaxID=495550 RepID=A0A3N0XK85_ANAGA|nr:E3 ubiquitin-protein ligase MARCH3 [Anabarilius grahami]